MHSSLASFKCTVVLQRALLYIISCVQSFVRGFVNSSCPSWFLKVRHSWCWEDGSVVKNPSCSSRESISMPSHLHYCSQLAVTPTPAYQIPFIGFCKFQVCMQCIDLHTNKTIIHIKWYSFLKKEVRQALSLICTFYIAVQLSVPNPKIYCTFWSFVGPDLMPQVLIQYQGFSVYKIIKYMCITWIL